MRCSSTRPWVAAAVIMVFLVVVLSYRQNVHAYPSGGGDYEVVSTNLGPRWGVFVASALMVDYVLTVAVSISSAVANAVVGDPVDGPAQRGLIAVGLTVLLALINLRGVRESGTCVRPPDLRVHLRDLLDAHLGRGPDEQRRCPARRVGGLGDRAGGELTPARPWSS